MIVTLLQAKERIGADVVHQRRGVCSMRHSLGKRWIRGVCSRHNRRGGSSRVVRVEKVCLVKVPNMRCTVQVEATGRILRVRINRKVRVRQVVTKPL